MTEKGKDRAITMTGSLIASIIVVLVGFGLDSNRANSKEIIHKIDSKVDEYEFQEKCKEFDKRATNLEVKQAEILEKNTLTLQEIVKQNAAMQTDIAWIKREIDRKPK